MKCNKKDAFLEDSSKAAPGADWESQVEFYKV